MFARDLYMATLRKIWLICTGLMLTCCGAKQIDNWMDRSDGIRVCTTTPFIADTVRQIGGDQIAVISLMGAEVDPHSYEIVKGDQDKLSRAEIVFANGLSL